MTVKLVHIDPAGVVFRGIAVPFHETAIIVQDGDRIVAEQFDEMSILEMPVDTPLLVSHRRDTPPAGIITGFGIGQFGLGIEGRLVGADVEIEGWRRRFEAGLMAGLSIGFTAKGPQEWRRPERDGAPPLVIRRGVSIVEVSLVTFSAYPAAGLLSLNEQTAAIDESRALAADMTEYIRDTQTYLAAEQRR
jgi:phage head maturation protease